MTTLVILTAVLYSCTVAVQGFFSLNFFGIPRYPAIPGRRSRGISAKCELYDPMGRNNVRGQIRLYQKFGTPLVKVSGRIYGLTRGLHGFHVHENGDFGNDCGNARGHYNPFNQPHGAPADNVRHAGDLGNVKADWWGQADVIKYDRILSLQGPLSIINRAIVVHADPDDLGRGEDAESTRTGNAGARLACCRIRQIHSFWY